MLRRNIAIWAMLNIVIFSGLALSGQKYSRRTPIVEAFQKSKDAVVSITSEQIAEVRSSFFDFWGRDYSPFRRYEMVPSLGSGFVISPKGYIVTNAHVVERASEITIIMFDKSRYKAQVIAVDSSVDLAILKVESDKALPTVEFCYDEPLIGETVLAIGNPFGYQHTVTEGILSAIHRDVQISDDLVLPEMLQISAPINPGNSGGPLLNINGEVIGINTAIRQAAQGIGFAIPIAQLRENLPRMINVETLRRIENLRVLDLLHSLRDGRPGEARQLVDALDAAAAQFYGFLRGVPSALDLVEPREQLQPQFRVVHATTVHTRAYASNLLSDVCLADYVLPRRSVKVIFRHIIRNLTLSLGRRCPVTGSFS